MCGIGLVFDNTDPRTRGFDLKAALQSRGPDFLGEVNRGESSFAASVLHIQGEEVCPQPYVSNAEDILLWNGEVFGGVPLNPEQSDTEVIAHLLGEAMDEATSSTSLNGDFDFSVVTLALSVIEGPYAFIYYHARSGRLVYGRDPFGRRSLVAARPAASPPLGLLAWIAAPAIETPPLCSAVPSTALGAMCDVLIWLVDSMSPSASFAVSIIWLNAKYASPS